MNINKFTTKEYQIGDNIKIISNNYHSTNGFLTVIITSNGSILQFNMFTCNKYASDQIVTGEFGKIISDNEDKIVECYKNERLFTPNGNKRHFHFFIRRIKDSDNYPNEYIFSYKKSCVDVLNKEKTKLTEVNLKPKPESNKTYDIIQFFYGYRGLGINLQLSRLLYFMKHEEIEVPGIIISDIKEIEPCWGNYITGIKNKKEYDGEMHITNDNKISSKGMLYKDIPLKIFNKIKYNFETWGKRGKVKRKEINGKKYYLLIG